MRPCLHRWEALVDSAQRKWTAGASAGDARPVRNPADQRDIVGHVTEVSEAAANDAMGRAQAAFEAWSAVPVAERASCLDRAADILQAQMPTLRSEEHTSELQSLMRISYA